MFGLAGMKLWGAIGAAVAVALFLAWVWRIDSLRAHYKKDLAACEQKHQQFVADVKARTDEARRLDAAHKAEVEQRDASIAKEKDSEIRKRIADAVAAVRVRIVSTPVRSGGSGSPPVSGAPVAAASPAGASQEAVVPVADLSVCAANTVKAEGWQDWWKSVEAVPR